MIDREAPLLFLRRRIRALSDTAEVIVVVAVALGYFAIESTLRLLQIDGAPIFVALPLQYLTLCQLMLMVLVCGFLAVRGWHLKDLGEPPRLTDLVLGVPIAIAAYLPFPLLWWLLVDHPTHVRDGSPLPVDLTGLDFEAILAGAFVNSLYEEVLVVGYLITNLRRRFSASAAMHISVLIRLSYHVHLGAAAILSILPLGYVFAYWYNRRRSLLPLVVAHTILDVIGFALYRVA